MQKCMTFWQQCCCCWLGCAGKTMEYNDNVNKGANSNKDSKWTGWRKVPDCRLLTKNLSISGSMWVKIGNGRSVSASAQRFKQRDKEALTILHRDTSIVHTYTLQEGALSTCPSWETYRLTSIQSSMISIQIEEQNHICHANSVDVCPCAWVASTMCCSVFCTHSQSDGGLCGF